MSSISGGAEDSLDTFMKSISGRLDKQKQSEIKLRIHQLNKVSEVSNNTIVITAISIGRNQPKEINQSG